MRKYIKLDNKDWLYISQATNSTDLLNRFYKRVGTKLCGIKVYNFMKTLGKTLICSHIFVGWTTLRKLEKMFKNKFPKERGDWDWINSDVGPNESIALKFNFVGADIGKMWCTKKSDR